MHDITFGELISIIKTCDNFILSYKNGCSRLSLAAYEQFCKDRDYFIARIPGYYKQNITNHPEQKDSEIYLIDVHSNDVWEGIPEYFEHVRYGKLTCNGMRPVFAKFKINLVS